MFPLRSRISGIGLGLPTKILTNDDLAKFVDTSDEWILSRTGIKERRILDRAKGESHTSISLLSAREALKNSGVDPTEIGLVICTTITPETWMPTASARIVGELGLVNSGSFDLNAACSGFIAGLHVADALIRSGLHRKVLVVATEVFSPILDWSDRKTCVLFGDGSGAAVVEAVENGDPLKDSMILGSRLWTQFDSTESLAMKTGGSRDPLGPLHISMNGQEVFKTGSRAMAQAATDVLELCGVPVDQVDWLVPHQANLRIIEMVAKLANFPLQKTYINVNTFGNTSAATVAICLAEMTRKKILKRGQIILLDVFGGGFSYGAMLLRW